MPTSVRAVTPSIARVASPIRGSFPSVSDSIKSSPIKMISIGPEGGRSRVDTTFGSPFARMRPVNPQANPSGRIFGENGSPKPRTAESVFGPKLGEIRFNRPAPKVGFTPEAAAKADVGTTFAQARARNQSQVAIRANQRVRESANQDIPSLPDQPIRKLADPLNTSIDFTGFQTIPQVKEPPHERAVKGFKPAEFRKVTPKIEFPEISRPELTKPLSRPQVRLNIQELARKVDRFRSVRNRQAEISQQIKEGIEANSQNTFSVSRLVEGLKTHTITSAELAPRVRVVRAAQAPDQIQPIRIERNNPVITPVEKPQVQELPKLTIDQVQSFTQLRPLIDHGILTEDQAMQRAGVINTPVVERPKVKTERSQMIQLKVEGVTTRQAEILTAMAPIIREGLPEVRERVFATAGVNPEVAQRFFQELASPQSDKAPDLDSKPVSQEQVALTLATQIIRIPDLGIGIAGESETEIQKRAQALIAVIRQTHQLSALGNNEANTAQLVERQLAASEIVPQRIRSRVSSLLVRMMREVVTDPTGDPSKKALHQVDLEKQNRRAKLAISSIDKAPRNEKGEIAPDFVIGQIQENNNQNYWGKLAIILKQNFDGSLDEMVVRLKKLKFWESPETVANTIDKSMTEYPAVEPALRQTTKEVGSKEVGKTMDPMWAEMIKSLIKTLIIAPHSMPTKA